MGTNQEQISDTYDTLAACWRNNFEIWAWCDVALVDLRRRLICKVCGRRSHRFHIVPEGGLNPPKRELPGDVKKKLIADKIARANAVVDEIRAEIRDGKPQRL